MFFEKLKNKGVLYTLEILIERIVPEWIFRFGCTAIFKVDLDRASNTPSSVADIQTCTNDELPRLQQLTFDDSAQSVAVAVCARVDAQMIGGFWAAHSAYRDYQMGIRFLFNDDQGWMYAGFVDKNHRRKGIYLDIIKELSSLLTERGVNHQYFAVSVVNKPSLAASRKVAQSIGHITSVKMFGVVWAWSSGQLKQSRSVSFKALADPVEIRVAH